MKKGTGNRKGFTILELLVASLLLSMLVTMLTMIFNQSSVAWTSGLASMKRLGGERMGLGTWHDVEDDLLPGIAQQNAKTGSSDNRDLNYRTVSLWRKDAENTLRANERAFDLVNWGQVSTRLTDIQKARTGESVTSSDASSANSPKVANAGGGVIVGVWSAGPNGEWGDEDDINTFPDEIN